MRSTCIFSIVAASLIGIVPALSAQARTDSRAAESAPAGHLVFREPVHDFGRIRDDHPVSWKFAFTNGASVPVTIVDVHSSCGCTTLNLEKKTYAPGEAGEIEAKFDPVNRQGKERKTITVKTDEPGSKPAELAIVVDVIPRIGVDPAALMMGEVRFDAVAAANLKREVTVTSRVSTFAVKSSAIDDARFSLVAKPPVQAEADGEIVTRFTFEVSLTGNLPIGRQQGMLRIETNDALRPQISIPVVIEAFGELQISPSVASIAMPKAGEPVEQVIIVSTRNHKPFKILEAAVTCETMVLEAQAEVFPGSPGSAWRIKVRGTAPAAGTRVSGKLKIKTDVAAQPDVEVVVSGYVLKPSQQH